jgi:hypothetical protein
MNYLPKLALNFDPPDLCLSNQDYRHEPPMPHPLEGLKLTFTKVQLSENIKLQGNQQSHLVEDH